MISGNKRREGKVGRENNLALGLNPKLAGNESEEAARAPMPIYSTVLN